jgi:hypothetical protein
MWLTITRRHLCEHHDHGQSKVGEGLDEGSLGTFKATVRPSNDVPNSVNAFVDRSIFALVNKCAKSRQNRVAGCSGFEPLRIENAEKTIIVSVVVQSFGYRLAHTSLRHIPAENRIHQRGFAGTGFPEKREIETAQLIKRLSEGGLQQSLNISGSRNLRQLRFGHSLTVRPSGYLGGMRKLVVLALVAGAIALAALSTGQWVIDNVRYRGLIGPMVVPAEYRDVLIAAADRCPRIPVEVLAAQIAAESGWKIDAISPAGAQGIAQFMPRTWEQYGLDGDGDGIADIWNPVDAIHSAAALNCVNRRLVRGLPGDRLQNTLAAYNAGPGAVRRHGGMPPFNETRDYVARIVRNAERIVFNQ